jgi:phosphoribosylformylglycinamidine synthase subunit PurQ / glutaminase
MKAKAGIVVFPGSNCDHDAYYALKHILNIDTKFLWHKESSIEDRNIIILPGGFSYGDYLRCGAIARFSSIMKDVVRFANNGGVVIGICNGFQILCETGILPGALLRNINLRFICKSISLKVENNKSIFTSSYQTNHIINLPVAHGDGNYYCDERTLNELIESENIVFKYNDSVNGSINDIAGIKNSNGNILGMMPHPERASDKFLGNSDGINLFKGLVKNINNN